MFTLKSHDKQTAKRGLHSPFGVITVSASRAINKHSKFWTTGEEHEQKFDL
ncbi:hypothetical protein SAMN04244570_0614 [Sporosarcina newyorkensis]|uniref:Uncharacterized protein n=1 Tax=Sporosarcina newyorkensis TaxID=759851 RepID=A0A1T4XEM7_9BACL|nr:hypothetical protein SAMN04244570_0614 [Sporosarcina newyorkensis]